MEPASRSESAPFAPTPSEAGAHAALFLAAMRDAHKAWTHTAMLARVSDSLARQVCDTLAQADAARVAGLVVDMAGPALASYQVHTRAGAALDAEKAMQLSSLVVRMFAQACVASARALAAPGTQALAMCEAMRCSIVRWIDAGACLGSRDLEQVDELIGHDAAIRLGLVAAFAPALAHCEIVARASAQGYPFGRA